MATAALTMVTVLILTPPAQAAPPHLVKKCSEQQFRQDNLALCNRQASPGLGVGGGGGGGGGLLGAIRDVLDGISGGLL
jgi:hypothetical protein